MKYLNAIGQYSKGLIASSFAVMTALEPYFGKDRWFVALMAGVGAVAVIMIPNERPPGES